MNDLAQFQFYDQPLRTCALCSKRSVLPLSPCFNKRGIICLRPPPLPVLSAKYARMCQHSTVVGDLKKKGCTEDGREHTACAPFDVVLDVHEEYVRTKTREGTGEEKGKKAQKRHARERGKYIAMCAWRHETQPC